MTNDQIGTTYESTETDEPDKVVALHLNDPPRIERRGRNTGRRRHHRGDGVAAAIRTLALGSAALALMAGVLGAGAGVAGAVKDANPSKPITNYPAYVGGHGKASSKLSPIVIGAVNQQTSAGAIAPKWTTGVKVAVQYVNQYTDGIDGHRVEVDYCAIPTTVGSAAKCGDEFANNSKISAVIAGAIDVGNTALESALKPSKKPIFWDVSVSAVDEHYPYGFIWWSTDANVNGPYATFAKTIIHAKSVSLIYSSTNPFEVTQARTVGAALKYEGIKTVHKAGFTGSDSNMTEPFDAADVAHTTLVIVISTGGPVCSNLAHTQKSLGLTSSRVVVAAPCATPTIAKADGGQLPHDWYYLSVQAMPGSKTKSLIVAKKVFAEYGKAPLYGTAWSEMGLSLILSVAKLDTGLLKTHKKVTPATLFTAARAFKGPILQGAPHIDCGGYKTPATCNDVAQFLENTAPTVMKRVSTWIGPPKGFKPPSAS